MRAQTRRTTAPPPGSSTAHPDFKETDHANPDPRRLPSAADPSILSAQGSGKKRASFRVVETTRFRRANGEPGERTTGFNCICFNEATAENYIQPSMPERAAAS